MAERQVSVEFVFDRSADQLVAQAYRMLVPERRARTADRRDGDEHFQTPAADDQPGWLGLVAHGDDRDERDARRVLGA